MKTIIIGLSLTAENDAHRVVFCRDYRINHRELKQQTQNQELTRVLHFSEQEQEQERTRTITRTRAKTQTFADSNTYQ